MLLGSETGSSKGDYDAVIQLSYYEYDPNCVQFTYWNGTDCIPDYDLYCQTFLDDAVALHNPEGDPTKNVTVKYNGKSCVIEVSSTETIENIEYVASDKVNEIVVEEVITKIKESDPNIVYVEEVVEKIVEVEIDPKDLQRGESKEQYTI